MHDTPDPTSTAGVLPAEVQDRPGVRRFAWGAASTTIPVLRVFSVDAAREFYVDFLRFTLDFGGPAGGPGTPFYGQVTRQTTTLHLTEQAYDPRPGATVIIQMTGLGALWEELNERRETVLVWGPAVWVPDVEAVPWGAHTLTIPDPFGNHLRFTEPDDPAEREGLPVWAGS
jgi:hypothetical protein